MTTEFKNAEEFQGVLSELIRGAEARLKDPSAQTASPTVDEKSIAKYLDQTLLKAEATQEQVKQLCASAKKFGFKAVCVNPRYVSLCEAELEHSNTIIACVVGFPLGATTSPTKVYETKEALENGAREIDMVICIGALKEGKNFEVFRDVAAVVRAAAPIPVKAIIEASLLSQDEKIRAALICQMAGASFVKTSTGFSTGGATIEDVLLLRKILLPRVKIKASGGVRDYETALKMIHAGADRIGTSSGEAIATKTGASQGSY